MGNQNTNNPNQKKGGRQGGMDDKQRGKQGEKSGTTSPGRHQDDDSRSGQKNDQQSEHRSNG